MSSERTVVNFTNGLLLGAVASSLVLFALPAFAHIAADWYTAKWRPGSIAGVLNDKRVGWRFAGGFPNGDGSRERTRASAYRWSSVGSTMSFTFLSGDPDYLALGFDTCPANPSDYQEDKVGSGDFGGPGFDAAREPLAQTVTCVWADEPYTLHSFKIKLNEDAPFYTKDTGEVPTGKWDLQSVMTHEFGHATGRNTSPLGNGRRGHFAEDSTLCPGPNSADFKRRHTMCPTVYTGTKLMRDLAEHDKDIFRNAYG